MFKFTPIVKALVWGFEYWVLSSVPGNESVVSEGPAAGRTVNEVYGGPFPLLIKFIDAKPDLSIQVHPGDELARERHGCKGKTEMWYVIGAEPGAHLLSGFSRKVSPDDYASLVESGEIVSVLKDNIVAPGDVFFIPSGRVHAIGGGCRIAEIQQTSDITYRLYDYGRKGLDGKPRQLHTELAKDAIDYTVLPDYRTAYDTSAVYADLVDCPYFKTSLLNLDGEYTLATEGRDLVLVCVDGALESGDGTTLKAGESALVLRSEKEVRLKGKARLLVTGEPR